MTSAMPLETESKWIQPGEQNERESVKAVFEHRPNENTLDSTNVRGKL